MSPSIYSLTNIGDLFTLNVDMPWSMNDDHRSDDQGRPERGWLRRPNRPGLSLQQKVKYDVKLGLSSNVDGDVHAALLCVS